MKYMVVSTSRSDPDRALSELVAEVNRMIEAGWKPLGGISLLPMVPFFQQSIIRQWFTKQPLKQRSTEIIRS